MVIFDYNHYHDVNGTTESITSPQVNTTQNQHDYKDMVIRSLLFITTAIL